MRETSVIALFALAAGLLIAAEVTTILHVLALVALFVVIFALTMRMVADILAAGFCGWCAAMGHGLGVLVASIWPSRPKQ